MAVSAKDVMALRKRTGLGMMECKEALTETGGDVDAAIEYLQEKLGEKMATRSDREAAEGAVAAAVNDGSVAIIGLRSETDFAARNDSFREGAQKIADLALGLPDGEFTEPTDAMKEVIDNLRITIKENISLGRGVKMTGGKAGAYVHHNGKLATLVELLCETDFVARNAEFKELARKLAMHVAAASPAPAYLTTEEVPADVVERERAIYREQVADKPEQIQDKIIEGKLQAYYRDNVLLEQVFTMDESGRDPSVREALKAATAKLGENIKIRRFVRMDLAQGDE